MKGREDSWSATASERVLDMFDEDEVVGIAVELWAWEPFVCLRSLLVMIF
jgi:hypothetical protein